MDGEWVTVPLVNDAGARSRRHEPARQQHEGNGLTGTSGGRTSSTSRSTSTLRRRCPRGRPTCASATRPMPPTSTRAGSSTTSGSTALGRRVSDLASGDWKLTTGTQTNNWLVQVLSPCDLSPGVATPGECSRRLLPLSPRRQRPDGSFEPVSRNKGQFTVVISNMPTGDLTFLDADYFFRVTNTGSSRSSLEARSDCEGRVLPGLRVPPAIWIPRFLLPVPFAAIDQLSPGPAEIVLD